MECGHVKSDNSFELIRKLEVGDHFGEIALVKGVQRTLSVKSIGISQLLSLTKSSFERIFGSIKQQLKGDYTVDKPYANEAL